MDRWWTASWLLGASADSSFLSACRSFNAQHILFVSGDILIRRCRCRTTNAPERGSSNALIWEFWSTLLKTNSHVRVCNSWSVQKSDFVVSKRTEHMSNVPVTVSETSSQLWSHCLFSVCFHCFHAAFAADFSRTLLPTPIATDGNWMHRTRRASCLVRRSLSSSLMRDGRISAAPSGLWSLSSHSQISAVGRGDERLLVESRRRKVETDLLRTDASGRDGRETRRGQN